MGSPVFSRISAACGAKVYGELRIHRWWDAVTDDIAQTWERRIVISAIRFELACSIHVRQRGNRQLQPKVPWGGGLGVSRYNDEGNWSALCHDVQRFT